jgi:hypothetical protein
MKAQSSKLKAQGNFKAQTAIAAAFVDRQVGALNFELILSFESLSLGL